ncbi:MAG: hypothetical protein CMJ41_06155 [Phycisphaerae bacterium]|nr:hypothetical protein [Phycisphaerae bacterium]HBZ96563.1 hypothetical protein [Phycisphaerales bacterium]|tara:strand:- start:353 stop:805 length:453 start_codon:yes stop_codon:yes gene_type:complete
MNTLIHNMRSSAIVCLVLGIFAVPGHASLSEQPDFEFQTAPLTLTYVDDFIAHSNQGGRNKKTRFLHLTPVKRSMPTPRPDAGTMDGLLVEGIVSTLPTRTKQWVDPASTPVILTPNSFSNGGTGGGIVPAPGALLVLGLAAARRRRRRR